MPKPTTNDEMRAQRRVVEEALRRVRDSSNSWDIVWPRATRGAIGFLVERPLHDYLTIPAVTEVPRGAAAICVFHKNYRPDVTNRKVWQIEKERHDAYADLDRNAFLQRAEELADGKPKILYARAMELGCKLMLDGLGYDVSALSGAGKKQSGIDLVGVRHDPEEEAEDQVMALECKTTAQGFEKKALRVFFNGVVASLRRSRDTETVQRLHPLIQQAGGEFDYLVATNREFKGPDFTTREGFIILRGIEVE